MARKIKYAKIKLNETQKAIVNWNDGPLIVSAGPGSGKSRVIVERIARLVRDGTPLTSIFATTFTRKAANVMNERLKHKGLDLSRASIQTMHSFCFRLLKSRSKWKPFQVDEKDISTIVIKDIVGYKNLNWNCDLTDVKEYIASCRNSLIAPENAVCLGRYTDHRFPETYVMYSNEMFQRRLITYDDMLYYGVKELHNDHKLLDGIRRRYRYIMVDEFQDSNLAQIELTDLVARPDLNLMVVGDIDQAIYSWRGAIPEFMLEFQQKYNATMMTLGINYRCAPAIVKAGASCIVNNEARITKDLISAKTNEVQINHHKTQSTDEEANIVANAIKELRAEKIAYGAIKVLMRTNAQSRAIEEEFVKHKIPFVVLSSISFYERKEIKDLLAYLELIEDPHNFAAGDKAINRPFRYISRRSLDQIRTLAKYSGNYITGIEGYIKKNPDEPVSGAMRVFVKLIDRLLEIELPSQRLEMIISETNYFEYLNRVEGRDTPENSRIGNVQELISSAKRFETTETFLKYIRRQIMLRKRNANAKVDNRVQVMTIHKSKGTEAQAVFLIGANEGLLPHVSSPVEEERRLFYVAITRAKNYLTITYIDDGDKFQVSRFVREAQIIKDSLDNFIVT